MGRVGEVICRTWQTAAKHLWHAFWQPLEGNVFLQTLVPVVAQGVRVSVCALRTADL